MIDAARPILVDTNVVIDYLRGHARAVEFLEQTSAPMLLSAITIAELYAGVRDGPELKLLSTVCRAFRVSDIDTAVASRAGILCRDFGKSHGVGLADAVIAASAEKHNATLVTLNKKHFPMLKNVVVPYAKA
jgi:hypothetical protein